MVSDGTYLMCILMVSDSRALQWSGNPYGNGYGVEMEWKWGTICLKSYGLDWIWGRVST